MLGTLILVLFGIGSAVLMGVQIGMTGISLVCGLPIVVAAYGLGAISGAHRNPAATLEVVAAGRMSVDEFVGHTLALIAGSTPEFAGLAIGLTLAAILIVGIDVTGVSVRPARYIGRALFVGGTALAILWALIAAPLADGFLAGVVYTAGVTRA